MVDGQSTAGVMGCYNRGDLDGDGTSDAVLRVEGGDAFLFGWDIPWDDETYW
jgi:hypothetical protein